MFESDLKYSLELLIYQRLNATSFSGLAYEIACAVAKPRPLWRGLFFPINAFKAAVFGCQSRVISIVQNAFDQFPIIPKAAIWPVSSVVATHTNGPKVEVCKLGHGR